MAFALLLYFVSFLALTKTDTSHVSGQTTSTTTTATDISNAYRASIYISIVQVGAATTAATVQIEVSTDGTNYFDYGGVLTAGTAAATYEWVVQLPDDAQNVRLVFTQQSGGTSSTLSARVGEVTGI